VEPDPPDRPGPFDVDGAEREDVDFLAGDAFDARLADPPEGGLAALPALLRVAAGDFFDATNIDSGSWSGPTNRGPGPQRNAE
jgi:hypothetical protein